VTKTIVPPGAHVPGTVIPGMGGTIGVTPITTGKEPYPGATSKELVGSNISQGTATTGMITGTEGGYEPRAPHKEPVRETPVVRDVGYGTRIQDADAQTKFGYNPYQQDTSQTRAYDTALSNLETQRNELDRYMTDAQNNMGAINQSIKEIQDASPDSEWTITYYDQDKGKDVTITAKTQEDALWFYNQQKNKAEQSLRDYSSQSNDLNRNIAVIGGYKESGYTIKETDQGFTFGLPKASDVYVYKHGRELSGIALTTASFLESPLAIKTLFGAGQQAITGEKKVGETRLEELSAYALGLDVSIAKGDYFAKVITSPAVIEGVITPALLMGGGALLTEVAGLAKTGLSGLTGKVTEYVAPITQKIAPFTSKITSKVEYIGFRAGFAGKTLAWETGEALAGPGRLAVEYIGVPSAKKAIIKYGMFAMMEGPGLAETARERPEALGGKLGESLFGWELGWGAMELGAKTGIPSGEQAYYKYGKPQPKPTDIYFKDTGRTTLMDIKEPYPQARLLTEKTPGTVTIIEEYPKRGRLELYEAERPKGGLEIPASYEQEVTRLGKGKKTLDIIEAKPGLTKGELLIEEPGKGRLTIKEFTPTSEMKYDMMLGTKTGLATPTSTLPYPGEGTGNLFESMPETTAQAIKSQELIHKPYDISLRPKYKTQGEAIEKIQSYYGEPAKPTSLTGAEPISEKGIFALDTKAEERIFYKEISGAEGKKDFVFDLGRTGVAKKEAVSVIVKGQRKVFTGEQLRGLGKGEIKARPQVYTREQLERALYKPGSMQESLGKQGRLEYRVIEEKPVKPGTRPETGWGEYLGERQEAKIVIEKPKEYALPELESQATAKRTVIPRSGKVPRRFTLEDIIEKPRYEPGPRKGSPFLPEKKGRLTVLEEPRKKTLTPKTEEGFMQSGTYESPDIKYITMERPLTRQEYRILRNIGDFDRTTGGISRYWTGTKPGIKTTERLREGTIHGLLSAREGEGKLIQPTLLGLGELTGLGTISVPRAEQQIKQTYGGDLIQRTKDELGFKQKQEPGLLLGEIPVSLTGTREDVRQIQRTESLQEQLQEQELEQGLLQEPFTETFIEPIRETKLRFKPREPTTEKPTKIIIPRIEPPKKPQTEEPSRYIIGEEKPGEAYDTYVKERSMYAGKIRKPTRFYKATKYPVTSSDAESLGGEITDNTSAISFRIKKAHGTPQRLDRSVQPFSTRAHKFIKKGETYIEKAEYRMDTPGEIKGISALGWGKRKGTGKPNGGLLSSLSSGSTRKKTNSLLASGNKLKENFLFRKKKNGGKKNDYY